MPHRILTPAGHSDETLEIAHDLLPPGYELVQATHGRPEFWDLLKDSEFYIGAGQYKHGPEFYSQAPKLKLVQTLSAGYNTYDLEAARAAGHVVVGESSDRGADVHGDVPIVASRVQTGRTAFPAPTRLVVSVTTKKPCAAGLSASAASSPISILRSTTSG